MSVIFDHARWENLKNKVRQGLVVKTHSGQVEPGDVFIALPGTRHDGSMYIDQALERGAAYVVASNVNRWAHDVSAEFLVHPFPQQGLGELAAAYFGTEQPAVKVVGITGTNGKTTTAFMLEHLLRASGRKVGVIGTVSVQWPGHCQASGMTTPDCWKLHEILARMMQDGVDVVCMEVSSHALDQDRVAGLVFDVAVFTNLTQDHLDYHHDLESYFLAKAKLFQSQGTSMPFGIINADDPYGRRLLKNRSYAMGYGLETTGTSGQSLAGCLHGCSRSGLDLEMTSGGASWRFHSPLVGRHNAMNLLAAQGAALALGVAPSEMHHLASFDGVCGRLQRITNARNLDVFVDYAHTPDALEKVCNSLDSLDFKRLFVVFGCGGDRDPLKRPLMGNVVAANADMAIVTSDNPRHEDPEAIIDEIMPGMVHGRAEIFRESDRKKAIIHALDAMEPGDALIIAGKGHETYQQIGDEKFPFNDARIVEDYLR